MWLPASGASWLAFHPPSLPSDPQAWPSASCKGGEHDGGDLAQYLAAIEVGQHDVERHGGIIAREGVLHATLQVSTRVVEKPPLPRYSLCMVPRPSLLGVLFGFLLALRAARMDPIHARRRRRVSLRRHTTR
jgi:hypothetical protein